MDDSAPQNPTSITLDIEGALSPDQLLQALNFDSGGFIDRYVEQTDLLNGLNDERLRFLVNGAVMVTMQLRTYVSEWIDTGVDASGMERPLTRNLDSVSTTTRRAISEFQKKYPIRTTVHELGKPGQHLVCDVGCHSLLKGERRLPTNAQKAALAWAQSFFVALLISPWKHRLCVCRRRRRDGRCGTFFMLQRAPKEKPYRHGVSCEFCANAVSAMEKTKQNRKDQREVLQMLAVEQCSFLRCECNPELVKLRSAAIAQRVTSKLQKLPGSAYKGRRIWKRICSRKWVITYAAALAVGQHQLERGTASAGTVKGCS